MTLILTESFDAWAVGSAYSVYSGLNGKHGRYVTGLSGLQGGYIVNGSTQATPAGRHGEALWVYGLTDSGRSTSLESLIPEGQEADTVVCGFALKFIEASTSNSPLLSFGERRSTGTLDHVTLNVVGAGTSTVTVQRGSAGGTALGTFTVPRNDWCYLEVKVKVHDTLGTVDVHRDGVSVLSLSGIDTRNAGTGLISRVFTGVTPNFTTAGQWYIDDWYLLTVDGLGLTDFLGDMTVEYLQPTADASVAWTPSAGANWDCVSDPVTTVAPQTSDYVSSATDNQVDLYTLADSAYAAPNNPKAVCTYTYCDKSDSGSRTLGIIHDIAGTQNVSSDRALRVTGTGTVYERFIAESKPGGGAWTPTDVNNLRTGVKARP